MENNNLIPEQQNGGHSDTESEVELQSETIAMQVFQTAAEKLLNINEWNKISGFGSANFNIFRNKLPEKGLPEVGDFLMIEIPGPDNEGGKGADWVEIREINRDSNSDADELLAITVKPASNPLEDKEEVDHFFDERASSTFMVQRKGNVVSASVHGRNEHANTDADNLKDKIRNTFVATGAMLGFSKIQWKKLTDGLVEVSDNLKIK